MNYRRIDNKVKNLRPNHAWIYYCLVFTSDFKTDVSHVKQESLAEMCNCSRSCIVEALAELEDKGLIEKKQSKIDGQFGKFDRNSYFICNQVNYRFMSDALLKEDISNELKGFLVMYWSLSLGCENYLMLNPNQCTEYLALNKSSIYKYVKEATTLGYIAKDAKDKKRTNFIREDIFIPARKSAYRIALEMYDEALTDEMREYHDLNRN